MGDVSAGCDLPGLALSITNAVTSLGKGVVTIRNPARKSDRTERRSLQLWRPWTGPGGAAHPVDALSRPCPRHAVPSIPRSDV